MRKQAEIRAEIDRLLADGRIEEADALVEQLIPISAEEFQRCLDEAPYDDEPVTAEGRAAFDRLWGSLARSKSHVAALR